MSSIFQIIKEYEDDFISRPVEIVEGYTFDQLSTIKENQRYYAGKFASGSDDEFGHKYFYNLGKSRVKNAAKNLDLDTKDIIIKATQPQYDYKAWIMRRDMSQWLRKRRFGKVLNEIVSLTPKYGSYVLKKVGGKDIVRRVNLKNLKNDPTCDKLEESQWIIEDHYYSPIELKREVSRGWDADAIDKAILSFRKNHKENYVDLFDEGENVQGDAQFVLVKEFYGEVPETEFNEEGNPDKFVLGSFIVVSAEGASADNKTAAKEGLILYSRQFKDNEKLPYKECHYDREEGRWLGVGIIEDLKDMQMLKNEQINLVVLSLKLANLVLFQTGDETIARNILTDLVNGDIIKAKGEISRINTQNVGLGNDQIVSREIEKVVNELSNSYEVTTGESLPSGTPFSLGMLINQNANKLFEFYRENIGLFLQEVFEDWIIPELSKDMNKQHLLEITSKEEMDWVLARVKSNTIWDAIKRFVLQKGKEPTQAEVMMAEQILSQRMTAGENLYLDIPDKFYDFEKEVEVNITGEAQDSRTMMTTLSSILQMTQGNPEALNSPIMEKILDLSGLSSIDVGGGIKQGTTERNQTLQVAPQANTGQI